MKKRMKNKIFLPTLLVVAVLLVLVGGQSVLRAQNGATPVVNNYAEGGIVLGSSPLGVSPENQLGSGTRFPSGLAVGTSTAPTLTEFLVDTTTTLPFLTRNYNGQAPLLFAAANTTTPGKIFRVQNTGAPLICTTIWADISTGSTDQGRLGAGGSMQLSFATSTASNVFSAGGASLVATTTIATGTTPLISNIRSPGTYVGDDQDIGGAPWLWGNGVWVLGALDFTDPAASSTLYESMVGEVQIDCYTR